MFVADYNPSRARFNQSGQSDVEIDQSVAGGVFQVSPVSRLLAPDGPNSNCSFRVARGQTTCETLSPSPERELVEIADEDLVQSLVIEVRTIFLVQSRCDGHR